MKKKLITTIAMLAGVATLATAVFANYDNANGYNTYKTAAKKLLDEQNYTANINAKLSFDDTVLMEGNISEMFDKNGDAKLYRKSTTKEAYSDHEYTNSQYFQDGMSIYESYAGGKDSKGWYVEDELTDREYASNMFDMFGTGDGNVETRDKVVNFVELIGDLVVGDLKNNFVLTSKDNGIANYGMHLENFQIPEVVNSGVTMMFSIMKQGIEESQTNGRISDSEEYFLKLATDPKVENANCYVSVDEEGRLVQNKMDASLVGNDANGNPHTVKLEITLDMSDYGTTTPPRLDLANEKNVRYASEMRKAARKAEDVEIIGGDDGETQITIQ